MACPTCDHTMRSIVGGGPEDECRRYYCPRCGTLKVEDSGEQEVNIYVPWLVERCQKFEKTVHLPGDWLHNSEEWKYLGIAEAIHRPEDRP